MTKLPTTQTAPAPTVSTSSLLMNPQSFEHLYRVGKMLASSMLFPEHLRKGNPEQAAANGALVMNMAARLNEDPLTVAQNIYFVSGKPGWNTSYLIAKANQHGVFENPIDWKITGKGDTLSATAVGTIKGTGKEVSYTCDMAMAKAEGWTRNAKYKSMPELMLRYRSAASLIRLYCPEVMVGMPASIEVETGGGEMRDITPQEFAHREPAPEDAQEAEIVDETPEPEPEPKEEPKPKAEPKTVAPKKDANAPDHGQFERLLEMIKRDLPDAPSVDEVIGLYGPQIEQMKEAAPDLYADLEAEFAEYRKAEGAE